MKNRFLILLLCLTALLITYCTSDPIVSPGSGTETVGTLVDKNGTPVKDAIVVLTDTIDNTQYVDSSDIEGKYHFYNLSSGTYTLWASLPDTSLVAIREDINFDSGTEVLGLDTMYSPGAITGIVMAGDNPQKLITINIPGTSYSATTDSTGKFVMYPVFPDTYSINFRYEDSKKDIIYEYDTINVIVIWDDTTNLDTIIMNVIPDGVPASPDTLFSSYDTLNETATVWWAKSKSPDIFKYTVNLDDGSTIKEIKITSDTVTSINLSSYLESKDSAKVKIFIHSLDSSNNKSTVASPNIEITAFPSALVTTTLEWEIFPNPLDTTIVDRPATLSLKYSNPTRDITTLLWWDMTNGDTLAITTPGKKEGTDTISYSWNKKGQFKIRVEAIDNGSHYWFSPVDTIYVYSTEYFRPENMWISNSQNIVTRRKEHSAAILNNQLYLFGGVIQVDIDNTKIPSLLNSIESSSIICDTIEQFTTTDSLPEILRYSESVTLNNKIFIIGGLTKNGSNFEVSNKIYTYEPQNSQWTIIDSLPTPLFGISSCTLNNMIYITGGRDNNFAYSNKIYKLDPSDLTCTEAGTLLKGKAFHQAVSDGKGMYILGGADDLQSTNGSSDIEYYSLSTQTSKLIGQMPQERMWFGAEMIGNMLYIFGGVDNLSTDIDGGTALNSVDIYDISESSWTSGASMPEELHSFATVSYNGLFYIIGGSNTFPSDSESYKVYTYYPYKEERSR